MADHSTKHPMLSTRVKGLVGECTVPGDKSISHRALMLGSQMVGTTQITGLLEGEDVKNTAKALQALGVAITRHSEGRWEVQGVGTGALQAPQDVLDMGNSGTGVRLLMGLLATQPFRTILTGDASLRKRPMQRVITPLEGMGASFEVTGEGRLPLTVVGTKDPLPMTYTLPVASAQVKSAILLAGLNTPGETTVIEPVATRDHTERMLRYLGATIQTRETPAGMAITLKGPVEGTARDLDVPADPSSAAFLIVAALITPGSDLLIRNICMNPCRIGLFTTLQEMGAVLTYENEREACGEPVADIRVRSSALKGVEVPAVRAASMIDEYPVLAVAAACASGTTRMLGLEELKVKECNRLSAIAEGLKVCGVAVEEGEDWLQVEGQSLDNIGGGSVVTHYDHRIAMAFLVLGMAAGKPVTVDDTTAIATSFPGFVALMNQLGGAITDHG
ncbi:MAG: 3-phosphoshikimate 1-carboxyvinyltransferase [Hyphomicrobiales bacterium]|nr:3-phosphoshikimate 1-carboxyvinyltransferase [Rickettsiales bacterium]MCP5361993.1 3-phosphoshikimate 1-carboxyvinyltransferase [Hyphomicrobiales bacterium]